jgi:hypothetical protein
LQAPAGGQRLPGGDSAVLPLHLRLNIYLRELIGARDAVRRPRLEYARRRDAHIEILRERGANERPQLLVLKDIGPAFFRE